MPSEDSGARVSRFLPSPSSVDYRVLWGIVLAAITLDIVTTVIGTNAGIQEKNPLVGHLLQNHGLGGLLVLKAAVIAWILSVHAFLGRRYAYGALVGLGIPQALAGLLNMVVLIQQ